MPLTPSPLIPGTSPMPNPGQQPPNKRALRLGALLTVPILVGLLAAGQALLPRILFLAPGLQAQANGSAANGGGSTATFQGFVYPWTHDMTGGGYTSTISPQNLKSEAHDFHMNAVIIPVVAEMPYRDDSTLLWHSTDQGDRFTLSDSDYQQAIDDAKKAGLVPILELKVYQDDKFSPSIGPQYVGWFWAYSASNGSTSLTNGKTIHVGQTERQWFDNYTDFAVHYAQMSQQNHLPYFIIGSDLTAVAYDTQATNVKADPQGIDHGVPGEPCTNGLGRRDCEWRHVVHAIRQPSYSSLATHQSENGASYSGKLIYEADWSSTAGQPNNGASQPEYTSVTWWDAIDFIGVDAEFPLTANGSDVDVTDLENAWNGLKTPYGLGGAGNIFSNLENISSKFQRQIIFTTAGYASASGANTGQPNGSAPDQQEQLLDMQALLETFQGLPWWAGVFWYADYPVQRSAQSNWAVSSNWAGDTLDSSKSAGNWLAGYYKDNPLH